MRHETIDQFNRRMVAVVTFIAIVWAVIVSVGQPGVSKYWLLLAPVLGIPGAVGAWRGYERVIRRAKRVGDDDRLAKIRWRVGVGAFALLGLLTLLAGFQKGPQPGVTPLNTPELTVERPDR